MILGKRGIKSTIKALRSRGIYTAGVLDLPFVSFRKEGVAYGFAAFSPNIGTVSIHNLKRMRRIVSALDKKNDIVIVSFHGGAEGSKYNRVPRRNEIFYGENRGNVHAFAHAAIDAGADIVFGHGPHVTRAIEVYKDRFIAYSLGNFCTYGPFSLRGPKGYAPMIKVNIDKKGRFIYALIYATRQRERPLGGVEFDPQRRAIKEIRRLTRLDGFMKNIQIDKKGYITKK